MYVYVCLCMYDRRAGIVSVLWRERDGTEMGYVDDRAAPAMACMNHSLSKHTATTYLEE